MTSAFNSLCTVGISQLWPRSQVQPQPVFEQPSSWESISFSSGVIKKMECVTETVYDLQTHRVITTWSCTESLLTLVYWGNLWGKWHQFHKLLEFVVDYYAIFAWPSTNLTSSNKRLYFGNKPYPFLRFWGITGSDFIKLKLGLSIQTWLILLFSISGHRKWFSCPK